MEPKSRTNKKKAPTHKVTPETQADPKLNVRAGDLNIDMVKELFLKSEFVEWAPFCVSMKWNQNSTRLKYPVAMWVKEKKELMATIQAEEIGDAIFRHKPQWHKDVLKVLQDAPALAKNMEALIHYRQGQITRMINEDIKDQQQALNDKREYDEAKESRFLKHVKHSDLVSLAMATKSVIEARQKAVLINNWSVPVAEQFSRPETIMNEQQSKGFTVEIIGHEKGVTSAELQAWSLEYYDPPQLPPIPKDEDKNEG